MKTIKLSRVDYKGSSCIFIDCDPDPIFNLMISTLKGRRWSASRSSWYINDREDIFRELLSHFRGDFRFDTTDLYRDPGRPAAKKRVQKRQSNKFGPVEMHIGNSGDRLRIKFQGHFSDRWVKEIKQFGGAWYDPESKEWTLPSSRIAIDSFSEYFAGEGVDLYIRKAKPVKNISKLRERLGSEIRDRELGTEAIEAIDKVGRSLREKRFSDRTINAYLKQIEFFFKYFEGMAPSEISMDDISQFMDDYIIRLGFSTSFQNQMISVLKVYSNISGSTKINLEELNRPRRGRTLPQVFSKDEVARILNSPTNLKHKLILWLIYSCGLRRSELLNIRIDDLNIERGILHIRSGKGDTDRVVPVSGKLGRRIQEYIESFRPGHYLFEGQRGGRYTASSVHSIFKNALKKCNIKREVGVHSLRHSYATHLHENGLDIRYIQELLGHKSSKTTEIYTHVSRRKLLDIRSPIDDLDLK